MGSREGEEVGRTKEWRMKEGGSRGRSGERRGGRRGGAERENTVNSVTLCHCSQLAPLHSDNAIPSILYGPRSVPYCCVPFAFPLTFVSSFRFFRFCLVLFLFRLTGFPFCFQFGVASVSCRFFVVSFPFGFCFTFRFTFRFASVLFPFRFRFTLRFVSVSFPFPAPFLFQFVSVLLRVVSVAII